MSYHEPCWVILSDLGGHLELSEALLEPSWAKKDGRSDIVCLTRHEPVKYQLRAVKGVDNPLPEL